MTIRGNIVKLKFRKVKYSCGAHTPNLCPCHNVWCTLNESWWLMWQMQSWTSETLHILCDHSVLKYNFWCTEWFCCVKWSWTCFSKWAVLWLWKLNLDIGLVERKLCSGLLRLPFSVSSPKLWVLQSLCELNTLNWCCDSIYNWKLTIFCVEYKYMYTFIQVSDLNSIKFSWNFSHWRGSDQIVDSYITTFQQGAVKVLFITCYIRDECKSTE